MNTKRCIICKRDLPLTSFVCLTHSTGRLSHCKPCHYAYRRGGHVLKRDQQNKELLRQVRAQLRSNQG